MIMINIQPVSTPRPRATRRGTVYYPKKYKDYLADLREELLDMEIPDGPLYAEIIFTLPRPKRLSKNGDRVLHTKRPDIDNLCKGVLDSLPIKDDARIVCLSAVKYYAASYEQAHMEILITRFNPKKNGPQ